MSTLEPAAEPAESPPRSTRIRIWPALVILVLTAVAWIVIWTVPAEQRQERVLKTIGLIAVSCGLLLVWALLFSRLRWRVRFGILGLTVLAGACVASLVELHGFTGDLLPVLRWRWKTESLATASSSEHGDLSLTSDYDYPQFLGPDRTGMIAGRTYAADWETNPPRLLWRQPVGQGWSGFAIAGHYAVTLEQRGDEESVPCYHLVRGDLLWVHSDSVHFESQLRIAGEGPRTVPSIVGDRVYTVGATGIVNCLNLTSGSVIWSRDLVQDYGGSLPEWGISCSPLVADGQVMVSIGGSDGRSLVALAADTGELVWSGGDDKNNYSSPVSANIAGTPQILIFNRQGVAAHDASNGVVLWEYRWPTGHPHIVTPLVFDDDRVLISSGYGTGSELIQVQNDSEGVWSTERIWKSVRLKSKFANLVHHDGYLYGLDDGIMVCLELATGNLQWKKGRYGHGQLILSGKQLLVMSESGDVVLIELDSEALRELARFAALDGKTWNPHALAGEYLLVRNDHEAACYRLQLHAPDEQP